jgi:hypothetical protein
VKRRTSTLPVKVYKYGIYKGPDDSCAEQVAEQFVLSRKYHNKLLELELAKRAEYLALRKQHVPGFHDAQTTYDAQHIACEAAATAISNYKAATKTRAIPSNLLEALKQCRISRQAAKLQLNALRQQAKENTVLIAQSAELDARYCEAQKAARATCSVYWGTYLLVEDAIERAKKAAPELRFRRWDGSGRIGVQIQGGVSVAALYQQQHTQLRISPHTKKTPTTLQLRIGSNADRSPIWATFTHNVRGRPLPLDGTVKAAWVQRRPCPARATAKKFQHRFVWELCVTVEAASFEVMQRLPQHACGINFGWRLKPDGSLRIGYAVGTDGRCNELQFPKSIIYHIDKAHSLESIRAKMFSEAKLQLQQWFANPVVNWTGLRTQHEWVNDAIKYAVHWRTQARLHQLFAKLPELQLNIPEWLTVWHHQDKHLAQWQTAERERMLNARNQLYRIWAKGIANSYADICIADTDFHALSSRKYGEDAQRHNRQIAAVSIAKAAIKLMAARYGCRLTVQSSQHVTAQCHVCSGLCVWDHNELEHKCEHCSAVWDQDANAARNLLGFSSAEAAE